MPGIIRDPKMNPHKEHDFGIVFYPENGKHYTYRKTANSPVRYYMAGEAVEINGNIPDPSTPDEYIDGIPVYGRVNLSRKLPEASGPVNGRLMPTIIDSERRIAIQDAIDAGMPTDIGDTE